MDTIKLLINESAGIYVPRNFYENFDFGSWLINVSDYSDLSSPDKDGYWEAWDDLLREAEHHDENGHVWRLEMVEGSLFAVRTDPAIDEVG
jgi:hypothetical protein